MWNQSQGRTYGAKRQRVTLGSQAPLPWFTPYINMSNDMDKENGADMRLP